MKEIKKQVNQEVVPYGDYDRTNIIPFPDNKNEPKKVLTGMQAFSLVQAIREGELEIYEELMKKYFGSEGY